MQASLAQVMSPLRLGTLELANRVVFSAVHLCYSERGNINQRLLDFYQERAADGMGLIIVGGCAPEQRGRVWVKEIMVDDDQYLAGLAQLARCVHAHGVKIAAQLLHGGSSTHPFITKKEPVSASDVPSNFANIRPTPLTAQGIQEVIQTYVAAAQRLQQAGFDAVELHGGMGYLINQFLSPLTNRRTDAYGGSLANRTRFVCELVQAIRAQLGDFPIILKLSGTDMMAGGLELADCAAMIPYFEKSGVTALHISPGWHVNRIFHLLYLVPWGAYAFASRYIKTVTQLPVMTSARIETLQQAQDLIAQGYADLVAMTRPFIADAHLMRKTLKGQSHKVRQCLACNKGCFDNMLSMKPVSCVLNPRVGQEGASQLQQAARIRKVVVCGAGPAGLQAACTAALRGHQVVLLEKSARIGGQLHIVSALPAKQHYQRLIDQWQEQIEHLPIDLRLQTPASAEVLTSLQPDVVVLAIGAQPLCPPISGMQLPGVLTVDQLFQTPAPALGTEIVIIGGGATGCEVAIYLAHWGALTPTAGVFLLQNEMIPLRTALQQMSAGPRHITILEMQERLAMGLGRSSAWVICKELRLRGIVTRTQVRVSAIRATNGHVSAVCLTNQQGQAEELAAHTVVLATGYTPDTELLAELSAVCPQTYRIGDCQQARSLLEAIHEGFSIGMKL